MSSLVNLIRDFQQLGLPEESPAADLFERALQTILEMEGPPSEPLWGTSTLPRTAVARTPKGRPMFLCHTWETGPWTCLLLDLPPVVMGRPVFLPNPAGHGLPRVVTDYQSQKFQRRIGAACYALTLPPPPQPCRICARLDASRLFLAWAPHEGNAPVLKGDLDNYAKNVLDALQRARVVTNDRTIAAINFSRTALPPAPESLDDHLLAELLRVREANPKLDRRALAKKAGLSQRHTQRLLARSAAAAVVANEPAKSSPVDHERTSEASPISASAPAAIEATDAVPPQESVPSSAVPLAPIIAPLSLPDRRRRQRQRRRLDRRQPTDIAQLPAVTVPVDSGTPAQAPSAPLP